MMLKHEGDGGIDGFDVHIKVVLLLPSLCQTLFHLTNI